MHIDIGTGAYARQETMQPQIWSQSDPEATFAGEMSRNWRRHKPIQSKLAIRYSWGVTAPAKEPILPGNGWAQHETD